MSDKQPSSLDLSRLPPSLTLVLALSGALTGAGSLGLRFGDPEPAASQAEVAELRAEISELNSAVLELSFQIRLNHQKVQP